MYSSYYVSVSRAGDGHAPPRRHALGRLGAGQGAGRAHAAGRRGAAVHPGAGRLSLAAGEWPDLHSGCSVTTDSRCRSRTLELSKFPIWFLIRRQLRVKLDR